MVSGSSVGRGSQKIHDGIETPLVARYTTSVNSVEAARKSTTELKRVWTTLSNTLDSRGSQKIHDGIETSRVIDRDRIGTVEAARKSTTELKLLCADALAEVRVRRGSQKIHDGIETQDQRLTPIGTERSRQPENPRRN